MSGRKATSRSASVPATSLIASILPSTNDSAVAATSAAVTDSSSDTTKKKSVLKGTGSTPGGTNDNNSSNYNEASASDVITSVESDTKVPVVPTTTSETARATTTTTTTTTATTTTAAAPAAATTTTGTAVPQPSRKKLKIDTQSLRRCNSVGSCFLLSSTRGSDGSTTPTPQTPSTTTSAQDTHPFARGAVIEVWYIQKTTTTDDQDDEDDWWSEPDSSEDDDNEDEEENNNDKDTNDKKEDETNADKSNTPTGTDENAKKSKTTAKNKKRQRTIRLCDIIDRAPIVTTTTANSNDNTTTQQPQQQQQWRYYVHYRDFNRRMDEWITQDRIVSPPSIGNAKARQIKREEERERRKQERLKQQNQLKQQQAMLLQAVNSAFGGSGNNNKDNANSSKMSQQRQQQFQNQQQESNNLDGGRLTPSSKTRRRRSTALLQLLANTDAEQQLNDLLPTGSGDNLTVGFAAGTSTTSSIAGVAGRRRRLIRRKTTSFLDDNTDAITVTSSNVTTTRGGGDGDYNPDDPYEMNASSHSIPSAGGPSSAGGPVPTAVSAYSAGGGYTSSATATANMNRDKKDVILGGADGSNKVVVSTQTVGEHVVGTVQALELDEHEGLDEASLREHEEVTKVKNVGYIELGRHQMETWYFSPLPKELLMNGQPQQQNQSQQSQQQGAYLDVLYVCEFTLRLFARKVELQRFQQSSIIPVHKRHPPGNEIYRNDNLAMFEIDGSEEKIYCQNLCYIAKLFLDHKTLYFDVDPFLFYVLCEVDDRGYHMVGYFSKEKYSDVGYNLACILAFPAHQRKGYGRFLISFSYELSKKEEKVGSPEKPLSDLGQQAYKPYWASVVIDFLLYRSYESSLSIMDIAKRTSIMAEDIVFTLNTLGVLKIINGVYFIVAERGLLQKLALKYPIKEPRVDPNKIHWTPFLTDIKRDKFSIHSKKSSIEMED